MNLVRSFLILLILPMALALSGCSFIKYLDGSSSEQISAFRAGYPAQVAAQKELTNELREVKEELKEQKALLQGLKAGAPLEDCKEQGTEQRGIRIKVLSGNGYLNSADDMAQRLRSMGYCVARTDLAPRSDFQADTVYFNKGFKQEAGELAGKLGQGVAVKPMTWYSIFDIIVVKGNAL